MELTVPQTLSPASVATFAHSLGLAQDEAVTVVRGGSAHCFCHGLDLQHVVTEGVGATLGDFASALALLADGLPTSVAWVRGSAQGGGVGVAAACDLVIAAPDATFSLPELLFGLVPATIWPVLRRRVAEPVLRRWLTTAETLDAKRALGIGLVDSVCEPDAVDRRLTQIRRSAGRTGIVARRRLQQMQQMQRESGGPRLASAIRRGAQHTAALLGESDVKQAMQIYQDGGCPWAR